jgi:type II secretory pathway pseudopilin PulG
MVVICIAGVLMALLLPALSQAKEKSRRSVCNQDMRQVIFAINMYGQDDPYQRLPAATDNKGDYHSIQLSSVTFTNLVEGYLEGVSNNLYCPNLVYATGTMGGYDPAVGFTIGYSYLAAETKSAGAKGPSLDWIGPMKASEVKEVIADANYWSTSSSLAMTVAPHTVVGALVTRANGVTARAALSTPSPAGSGCGAMGAKGGNIGFLSGSVFWRPINSMSQYPASTDGTCFGNW